MRDRPEDAVFIARIQVVIELEDQIPKPLVGNEPTAPRSLAQALTTLQGKHSPRTKPMRLTRRSERAQQPFDDQHHLQLRRVILHGGQRGTNLR